MASFDPFTNQEITDTVKRTCDLNSSDELKKYFELPVKCLLRIEKSVELRTKELGANGFFMFIEDQIGQLVEKDEKMDYAIMIKNKDDLKKLGIDVSSIDKNYLDETEDIDG